MAIRNSKIRGTDYVDGEVLFDYDLDDTNDAIINQFVKNAELGVRILQANNIWTQGPNLLVDEFNDSNGREDTVNTSSSTAFYNSGGVEYILSNGADEAPSDTTHDPDGATNPENAFDGDDNTDATFNGTGFSLGKTFTAKTVLGVKVKATANSGDAGGSETATITLQSFDGSTWSTEATLSQDSGPTGVSTSYNNIYYLNKNVEGVRVSCSGTDSGTQRIYTIEYSSDYSTSDTLDVDSNTLSLDGNEIGFAVSIPDSDIPTNTSIDVTIGDGSTTLTSTTVDSASKGVVIGNGTDFGGPLSSGTLEVTFTLNTSDTSVTPSIKSYGVDILR